MEAFTTHTGRAVPLRRSNVDTDQIIPAHWLKKVTRDGFEDGLFEAWRKDENFVLNRPERKGASVLVGLGAMVQVALIGHSGADAAWGALLG